MTSFDDDISSQLVVLSSIYIYYLRAHWGPVFPWESIETHNQNAMLTSQNPGSPLEVTICYATNSTIDEIIWYNYCMEYRKQYPLQTYFVMYLIIIIIFHPWIKSSPSFSPLQLSRFLLVPFHMGQRCIYISGTRSCWRRSLVCQWWLNMRLGCRTMVGEPQSGIYYFLCWGDDIFREIWIVFWMHWNKHEQTKVIMEVYFGGGLPFHTLPARPWRKSYWQVIQIDWSPSWPSSLGGF